MLRHIIALGTLAAIAAPAAAQVDTSRGGRGLPSTTGRAGRTYSVTSREGWLGIGLSCSRCSLTASDDGAARQWTFSEPPLVFSVDRNGPADRAALRTGDTLVAIDAVALTTPPGGRAFANIRPGQSVRLTYRRDGAEHVVRLVAQARPITDARALASAARALRLAEDAQARQLEMSRDQLLRARNQIEQMREELEVRLNDLVRRRVGSATDSLQIEALRRALEAQQSALARVLEDRAALEGLSDSAGALEPAEPAMPSIPALAPTPPAAALLAMPAMPALAPLAPMSYAEHRGFGPLRYTGRLGDVIIEARGAGGVTATEVSDSEVVVTSGDLSVRLALRPRATTAKPAAQPPAPARPPQD